MSWRQFINDYLSFTRKDRIGILVIGGILILVLFVPTVLPKQQTSTINKSDTAWIASFKKNEVIAGENEFEKNNGHSNDNASNYQYDRSKNSHYTSSKGELFYFDPNTISGEEWKRLGLRDKTIGTIQNYLSKGGHFYKPEDLSKIYGLFEDEFARLEPYIRIEKKQTENAYTTSSKETFSPKTPTERYSSIDINAADTTAYIALPGIGSKLAARIVNFRDKLGGFYSIEQVGETFGLPDSTFQKIKRYLKVGNGDTKKININTATVDELKAHPYIKYSLANPIVAYRKEHGDFKKLEDLKNVMVVTEEVFRKIAPYLIVQ